MQGKRATFVSILEQREAVHKDGWNVATSQRHDVGSTYIEVNKRQHRDVSTSRRLNVVTSQRRDINASYASQSLKAKGDHNSRGIGDRGTYELGHGNHSSKTLTLEKSHHFVSSSFWTERLMFYRLTLCVFSFSMF